MWYLYLDYRNYESIIRLKHTSWGNDLRFVYNECYSLLSRWRDWKVKQKWDIILLKTEED